MQLCPRCGEENPDRFRFCGACGGELVAEAAAPRDVRKTVTVVFCDVAGSTTLGEGLDPESLRRVMGRYFGEMRAVLERHGGTVEKFIGDAIMAVFGMPVLHEDDALRAVRAAAEMRAALAALNDDLEREWGVRLEIRTGVNTGEVVAGDPAADQTLVTGDAVNVAARLEQAAAPGEILIGADTERLVRDAVRVEAVEPRELKGKADAVAALRLLDVVPETPGYARRLDSPLVGREREGLLLQQAYERAVAEAACHLFTVLGAAGVGKSRLVREFVARACADATVASGRCLSYGEGITFWPLIEVMKQLAELGDGDEPAAMRAKITGLLEDEEGTSAVVDRLAQVLGLNAPGSTLDESFWAVRKLFETVAQRRPLVVVFDDCHWAEPSFLDLIESVADWSRDAPILLVCMARPELLEARPGWGGGKLNATSILLDPLAETECERLVENLLGAGSVGAELRRRIVQAAEGNPLFVEETLAMLLDEGRLRRENDEWVPTGDLAKVELPATIHALLSARLDQLDDAERRVLERAAVVGKVFWRGAVAALSSENERLAVAERLLALVRKELIRPERSRVAGEEAFRFRHLAIRDAAYEFMPKQERSELHERFVDWLEQAPIQEYDEILGYHLQQAYRYRLELAPLDEHGCALAERAAERLATAGRLALDRGDAPAAATLLRRAAELADGHAPDRLGVLIDLADALGDVGDFAAAEAALAEALERTDEIGDPSLHARALIQRAVLRMNTAAERWSLEACRDATEALRVFGPAGDERGLAQSWLLLARYHWGEGRISASAEACARALEHARRVGDRRLASQALGWLALQVLDGPISADEGLARFDAIMEEAAGDRKVEAFALLGRATLEAMQARFDRARELQRRGRAILEDLGLSVLLGGTAHAAVTIELLAGDAEAAEREARAAYDLLDSLREREFLSSAAADLADALCRQGRCEEAERFAQASAQAATDEDVVAQIRWRRVRAEVLARREEPEEAERLAQEAVEIAGRTEFVTEHAEALLSLVEVRRGAGRAEEAAEAARQALALYELKGNLVSADRTRALLAATV